MSGGHMGDTHPTRASHRRRPDQVKVRIAGAWTASPNRLLQDRRISRDARLLGALMFMHAGNSGVAFPSQEVLAEELSHIAEVVERDEHGCERVTLVERQISIRSVQRWLSELKRAGWLRWRQTMRCNEYTLLDPHEPSDLPDEGGANSGPATPPPTTGGAGATPLSPNTTQGSSSNTTQGSPTTTPVSPSTLLESDSLDSDSSSSARANLPSR